MNSAFTLVHVVIHESWWLNIFCWFIYSMILNRHTDHDLGVLAISIQSNPIRQTSASESTALNRIETNKRTEHEHMAMDATNNSQQKPTTTAAAPNSLAMENRPFHICLDYNVCNRLHASYCYRLFVCDEIIIIFGFWFYILPSVCVSAWLCMHFKCIVCGYALWSMPFAVFDLHLYRHRYRNRYVCESETVFLYALLMRSW